MKQGCPPGQSGSNNPFYGQRHSPESKAAMSDAKKGANNPMYGQEKSSTFWLHSQYSAFKSGAENPQFKGTYVLDVELNVQFGPLLKAEVLRDFYISLRMYYQYLNKNLPYKGYKYSHTAFDAPFEFLHQDRLLKASERS